MEITELFGRRLRQVGEQTQTISHQYLLRGGYVRQLASGIFSLLPLGRMVIRNIEEIIREEMDSVGAQEVTLPVVMPKDIWEESGRYASIGKEMARFKDRNGHDLLLGMTHEEAVVALARSEVASYRDFPFCLYQIQTKFRDEPRPRAGLLTVREFLMKDAYSFHTSQEDLENYYSQCYSAYERVFSRCGIKDLVVVQSDPGMMGGKIAHEFMLACDAGEDTLVICSSCDYRANQEVASVEYGKDVEEGNACNTCGAKLRLSRGVELGNIFQLGDKYTSSMGMSFADNSGKDSFPVMGCYGIGVGRLMASVIEQYASEKGMVWPKEVAPFKLQIIVIGEKSKEKAINFYQDVYRTCKSLIDYRKVSAGEKFADADLIGAPIRIVVNNKSEAENSLEIEDRATGEKKTVSFEQIVNELM